MAKKPKDPSASNPITVPTFTHEEVMGLLQTEDELRAMSIVNIFGKVLPTIPKNFELRRGNAESIRNAFHMTFQLVGGVGRMALWADEDFPDFMKTFARVDPAASAVSPISAATVIINSNVPSSPLDDQLLDSSKGIIDVDIVDDSE